MKKLLLLIIPILIFVTGCLVESDAKKFANEYEGATSENPFKYLTIEETIDFVKNKTGVIYIGDTNCPYCQTAVPVLIESLKVHGIDEAYYLGDFLSTRPDKNENSDKKAEYKELSELFSDFIEADENEYYKVFVPIVIAVKDGKVMAHHTATVRVETIDPETGEVTTSSVKGEMTSEQKAELINIYNELIESIYPSSCKDDTAC